MKSRIIEITATFLVVILLAGTPLAINYYRPWKPANGERIIFLTGIASQGIWTEDIVNGTNYWNTKFKRANIFLKLGEEVIFRFTSMDVTHTFYAPELGIGPEFVLPGIVNELHFKATKTGKFTYYCTTFCGQCHLFMQGFIYIVDDNDPRTALALLASEQDTAETMCTAHLMKVPEDASFLKKGELLFLEKGCFSCHGALGRGGVINPNYANKTIPTLNDLASKLQIKSKKDGDKIIALLEKNADFDKLSEDPPFRTFARFLAQYQSIITKIHDGAPVLQKLDSAGYDPPLQMPSWENYMTDEEINSIIGYLISINNWRK